MTVAHREPAAPSGSLAKRNVHPQGWLCVNGFVLGHVAYSDNQIHSDSKWAKQRVILLSQSSYFWPVKESKDEDCRQRKLHRTLERNKLRKSWFSLPHKPDAYLSQKMKSISAHTPRSSTFVPTILVLASFLNICHVDSICYLGLETRDKKGDVKCI